MTCRVQAARAPGGMVGTDIADAYRGRVVVVSGASGYIGTNLVRALAALPCRIVRLSRSRRPAPPPSAAVTIEDRLGDIRDAETWMSALAEADIVFHLAAQTGLAAAESDPAADLECNVLPMLHLIGACRALARSVDVVFAGTVTQTGIPTVLPVDESQPDRPITIYDAHKLVAETYLALAQMQGVLEGGTLRLANVFGPGPPSGGGERGILNLMIRRAIAGKPVTVYRSGPMIRDYLYVDDVIQAFLCAGAHARAMRGRHFVIGSGEGRSIADAFATVAEAVERATGRPVRVDEVPPPRNVSPIAARDFVADSTAFRDLTGWRPATGFAEGIDRTIAAILAQDEERRADPAPSRTAAR